MSMLYFDFASYHFVVEFVASYSAEINRAYEFYIEKDLTRFFIILAFSGAIVEDSRMILSFTC